MSSIDNRGENEFADDESNIVGKSEENSEEEDPRNTENHQKRNIK